MIHNNDGARQAETDIIILFITSGAKDGWFDEKTEG
jgi:hypothetical protein